MYIFCIYYIYLLYKQSFYLPINLFSWNSLWLINNKDKSIDYRTKIRQDIYISLNSHGDIILRWKLSFFFLFHAFDCFLRLHNVTTGFVVPRKHYRYKRSNFRCRLTFRLVPLYKRTIIEISARVFDIQWN